MQGVGIHATISANAGPLEQALKRTEIAAQAWGIRMAGITSRAGAGMAGGGGAGGGGRGGGGMAILELSRGIEDAQYGMRGIMNNIPGLIQQLGGSGGLAGAASIAAVAAFTLGTKIKAWIESAKIAAEETKEYTDAIGEMEAKLREADIAAAKKGSIEGNQRLAQATAESTHALQDGSAKLEANVALERESADAKMELIRATKTAQEVRDAEMAALIAGQEKEKAAIKDKQKVYEESHNILKRNVEVAEKELKTANEREAVARASGNVGAINMTSVQRIAAEVDLKKAQDALNKEDNATLREKTTLTNKLHQLEEEGIIKIQTLEAKHWAEAGEEGKKEVQRKQDALDAENKSIKAQGEKIQKQQEANDKETEALKEIGRERQKNLNALESSIKIQRLRDQGRDTQADREERKERINTRAQEIQDDMGVSPARARRLAEDEIGPRKGRIDARSKRTRGAGGIDGTRFTGLDAIEDRRGRSLREDKGISQSMRTEKGAPSESDEKKLLASIDKNIATLASAGNAEKSKPVPRVA